MVSNSWISVSISIKSFRFDFLLGGAGVVAMGGSKGGVG